MILVGDSVLCEELKSRIETSSVEEKEKAYHSLLALLKLPAAEYSARVNRQNFLREVLSAIESDIDTPSAGGILQSQQCLFGTLGLYRHHLDQTLPVLLNSDLVGSAPNSQMRPRKAGLRPGLRSSMDLRIAESENEKRCFAADRGLCAFQSRQSAPY